MADRGAAGRRVLACDDELKILRALKLVLRPEGYEVLTAASIEEALDVVALSAVDAAFKKFPGQIAAIILEPYPANVGLILPDPGYLAALRRQTRIPSNATIHQRGSA